MEQSSSTEADSLSEAYKFSALDITPNPLPCEHKIPTGLYIETDETSPLSPILFL